MSRMPHFPIPFAAPACAAVLELLQQRFAVDEAACVPLYLNRLPLGYLKLTVFSGSPKPSFLEKNLVFLIICAIFGFRQPEKFSGCFFKFSQIFSILFKELSC